MLNKRVKTGQKQYSTERLSSQINIIYFRLPLKYLQQSKAIFVFLKQSS